MERVSGIEPPCPPWQGGVLPLNYTRVMAVPTRFELAIFSVTGRRDKPLLHGTNVWRGKRDLNPRAGFPTYALSRGTSSASWVFPQLLPSAYWLTVQRFTILPRPFFHCKMFFTFLMIFLKPSAERLSSRIQDDLWLFRVLRITYQPNILPRLLSIVVDTSLMGTCDAQ